jgi:hypothetical protein
MTQGTVKLTQEDHDVIELLEALTDEVGRLRRRVLDDRRATQTLDDLAGRLRNVYDDPYVLGIAPGGVLPIQGNRCECCGLIHGEPLKGPFIDSESRNNLWREETGEKIIAGTNAPDAMRRLLKDRPPHQDPMVIGHTVKMPSSLSAFGNDTELFIMDATPGLLRIQSAVRGISTVHTTAGVTGSMLCSVDKGSLFGVGETFDGLLMQTVNEFGFGWWAHIGGIIKIVKHSSSISIDDITTEDIYEYKAKTFTGWVPGHIVGKDANGVPILIGMDKKPMDSVSSWHKTAPAVDSTIVEVPADAQ